MTSAMSTAETAQVTFTRVAYTREHSDGADSFDTAAPAFVMESRPMSRTSRMRTIASVAMLLAPAAAQAQQTPLSEILPVLLGNAITLQPSHLPDQPNHVAHFQPGTDQLKVPAQMNEAVLTLLSTYPIGTPGGGFTYMFDPALGTLTRTSDSFGPSFAERALTTGRGKVSVGFAYQHARYDTFEGLNLRQRQIVFYVPHADCCSPGSASDTMPDGSRLTPPFEGDLIDAGLDLQLVSDTSTVFVTYGISNRFDVGVAVPFVRVTVDANVLARIERLATAADPTIHSFEGPNPDQHVFSMAGSAAGLGDIFLRAKYRVPAGPLGVAAVVETRVPTGDENNLLGTGGMQTRVLGVLSVDRGRLSPHLNLGYTFSGKGALFGATMHDEVLATAGGDLAVTSRVTMSFDVLGRTLLDAGRMRLTEKTFEFTTSGGAASGGTGGGGGGTGGGGSGGGRPTPAAVQSVNRTELQFFRGNLQLYLGAAGVRFNPLRNVVVSANLLFPLTKAGLRDRVTPEIGIDYVF